MSTTDVNAKDVMALRQKTGLGMMDCKKALIEAGGDAAGAEEALREKLKGKMDTRADRAAGEGCITIVIDGDQAVILEMRAETDFTARNDSFRDMSATIAAAAIKGADGDIELGDAERKLLDDVRITTRSLYKWRKRSLTPLMSCTRLDTRRKNSVSGRNLRPSGQSSRGPRR